ncbi:MAG: hypothetical protein Ct9H90mP8_2700 [Pseudomonadota bacterium]|nr:MAG: hypothetical protein Ct9H90mP8_2700 [Pseudomonadota bacterium]
MRKTLLVQALLQNPELLILDEPFEGLDQDSLVVFFAHIPFYSEGNPVDPDHSPFSMSWFLKSANPLPEKREALCPG